MKSFPGPHVVTASWLLAFLFKDPDPNSAFLISPHPRLESCLLLRASQVTGCHSFPISPSPHASAESGTVAHTHGSTHVCSEETETIFEDVTVPEKGFCSREKQQEAERTGVSTDSHWEPRAGTRAPGARLRKRLGFRPLKLLWAWGPGGTPQCG